MPTTDNHSYNVPNHGDPDWHLPLNDNFRDFDVDVEVRDTAGSESTYTPAKDAKFVATDTGEVSLGDGADWVPSLALWRYLAAATAGATGNLIAGHASNVVAAGTDGATIAGGGYDDGTDVLPNEVAADYGVVAGGIGNVVGDTLGAIGGGRQNEASGNHSAIGGGARNAAGGDYGTVSGGAGNTAGGAISTVAGGADNDATAEASVVGGGDENVASGEKATVAGGSNHDATGESATIAGGEANTASDVGATAGGGVANQATGERAAIGGGSLNEASALAATVAGGNENVASGAGAFVGGGGPNVASGTTAAVAGGFENEASGTWAAVPGGSHNVASGHGSVAAGINAAADARGSFVWNDGTAYHDTDGDGSDDRLAANQAVNGESVTGDDTFTVGATGGVRFVTGSSSVTYIPSGSTGWSTTSTRAAKTNVEPVDPQAVLAGVASLDVATWEYRDEAGEGAGTTHVGPMAEDFHAAFDVGDSDSHINAINADGVALAAIQGLAAELEVRDERIAALESTVAEQERRAADQAATIARQCDQIDELTDGITALSEQVATLAADAAGGGSATTADD